MKELLEVQRRTQIQARLSIGSAWGGPMPGQGDCFVFSTDIGTALDRNNISRVLRSCLDQAGLKRRGIHALRHTFATNCIRAGMDVRTLSEILGHADVALTLRLYVHSDMETKRAGMRAIEELF